MISTPALLVIHQGALGDFVLAFPALRKLRYRFPTILVACQDKLGKLACHLEIAGIDLIVPDDGVPRVIEVNYSPGFRGLEKATGIDVAGEIIDYVTIFRY